MLIFEKEYLDILEYDEEDKLDSNPTPKYLVPLIPLILINGANGIAVGYSTYIA